MMQMLTNCSNGTAGRPATEERIPGLGKLKGQCREIRRCSRLARPPSTCPISRPSPRPSYHCFGRPGGSAPVAVDSFSPLGCLERCDLSV